MGWDRKEIKKAAEQAVKDNYWKSFFVSLLLIIMTGGATASTLLNGSSEVSDLLQSIIDSQELSTVQSLDEKILIILAIVFSGVAVLYAIFKIVIMIFLTNPLEIGLSKFMLKTATARLYDFKHQGKILELAYAFDNNYLGMVKVMFFRSLYIILWSFLLFVPGIVKYYEYRMVPFILCEHPNYTAKQTLELSKQMMKGEKWNAFLLDLSFLGLHILGVITLGIVEIFYVAPYVNVTNANLYRAVRKDYNKRLEGEK